MSDSLWPHVVWPTRLLCPWDSPGKNTGVGCHSFIRGIFPTQRLNLGLLYCRQILYGLSHTVRKIQSVAMDINYSTLSTTLTSICWVLPVLEGGRCLLSNRKYNWLFAPSYCTDSQQWSVRSASPIPQSHLEPWVAASALNSGSCAVAGSLQARDAVIGSRGGVLFSLYPSVTDLTHWKCVSCCWKITVYISTGIILSVPKRYRFKFIGPQRNECIGLVQNAQALGEKEDCHCPDPSVWLKGMDSNHPEEG